MGSQIEIILYLIFCRFEFPIRDIIRQGYLIVYTVTDC